MKSLLFLDNSLGAMRVWMPINWELGLAPQNSWELGFKLSIILDELYFAQPFGRKQKMLHTD